MLDRKEQRETSLHHLVKSEGLYISLYRPKISLEGTQRIAFPEEGIWGIGGRRETYFLYMCLRVLILIR